MQEALTLVLFFSTMLLVPWLLAGVASTEATLFASSRERRLWLWVLVVVVAIYASLGPAATLAAALRQANLLRATFALILLLGAGIVIWRWTKKRPNRAEIGVAIGVVSAYVMAWVRMDSWEERTHLFEYGLVALLIHQALIERQRGGRWAPVPALFAVVLTALLGWLDEGIQALLPNRVYDIRDVGFNALAGLMAVLAAVALAQARRWWQRRQSTG